MFILKKEPKQKKYEEIFYEIKKDLIKEIILTDEIKDKIDYNRF